MFGHEEGFCENGVDEVDNLTPSINHVAGPNGKYFCDFVQKVERGEEWFFFQSLAGGTNALV